MQTARLELDSVVEVRVEDGRVVIEPMRKAQEALADLLAGITEAGRHDGVETGAAIGDEAL